MIRGVYLSYNDDLTDVHDIRKAVFTDELGIPEDIERDDNDMMAMHAVLEAEGGMVATGRMKYDGDTFELDKVAVLPDHRRNGYADFVVRMLLDKVFLADGKTIYANVIKASVPFFETIGFIPNGDAFTEGNIDYLPMKVEKGGVKTLCGGHDH
ncbi:MAG: GNAT family N-acetyltransferase [Lachnospiraceae bacterium]|nr:GNAT family N-acetyltransferase [Lachnospiraceae bacterium]